MPTKERAAAQRNGTSKVRKGRYRPAPKLPTPSGLHIKMATKFALLGLDGPGIARGLEIGIDTFTRFMRDFPEFRRAVNDGKITADAEVAHSAYHQTLGPTIKETHVFRDHETGEITEHTVDKQLPPSTSATIFWLKNRQRAYWRDVSDKNINIDTPVRLDDPRIIDVTDWSEEERQELERKLLEDK